MRSNTTTFVVGTDVGGTFTDLWVRSGDGRQAVIKVPTTGDIIGGIENAVREAADHFDLPTTEFCSHIQRFGHGTTAALNALLTGNSAPTGIITTAGFADTLEIGRLKRQVSGLSELEVGDYLKRNRWAPIVPRTRVVEVPERIDRTGNVLLSLDEDAARTAIQQLKDAGVEAVAICTLWSTANPIHEIRLAELIREIFPRAFVAMSHKVAPTVGEFARMSTVATNAALGPIVSNYLSQLDKRLDALGLTQPVMVMTGSGGISDTTEVSLRPIAILMSGPAAGVSACAEMSERLGYERVITVDVGGTSFDVATVIHGSPSMRSQLTIAGADIHYPAVDVGTIGAGGGSIAAVRGRALAVGPQSAGANPGPACYGRGGIEPTATDADLILGVLAEDTFAGGLEIDRAAAERAIREKVAEPLGLDLMRAAWGIRVVLDNRMADLLRTITIERGLDPADFVLFANGGQGPSHAWALCQQLGIRTFVVTPTATVQSAMGAGTSELRASDQRPTYLRLATGHALTQEQLDTINDAIEEASIAALGRLPDGHDGVTATELSLAIRYRGQAHHLDIPVDPERMDFGGAERAIDRFEHEYELLFGAGSGFSQAGFEVLSARVIASAPLGEGSSVKPGDPLIPAGERLVVFNDPEQPRACPVFQTRTPAPNQHIAGPALVQFPGQTLVIPPGAEGITDDHGNFVVTLMPGGEEG